MLSRTSALAPFAEADGQHDGADADEDAEHREGRAQAMGADRLARRAEGVAPVHGRRSASGTMTRPSADLDRAARPWRATSGSWVISTIVRPAVVQLDRGGPAPRPWTPESRLPVGSSARIIPGSVTRARAMATRCCWPPDSSPGLWAGPVGEADRREGGHGPFLALARAHAGVDERQLDVAPRRQVGEQVELLEDEADEDVAHVRELVLVEGLHVVAGQPEDAGRRHVEAAEDVHERRLARARRPGDGDELVLLDAQRDVAQGDDLGGAGAVDLAHVDQLDDRRSGCGFGGVDGSRWAS